MKRTFKAVFMNRQTGLINEILLESVNIWAVTEYCSTLEIPDIYEVIEIYEILPEDK